MNRKHLENRSNRVQSRDRNMIQNIGNMWYNPRAELKKREADREKSARVFLAELSSLRAGAAHAPETVLDNDRALAALVQSHYAESYPAALTHMGSLR